MITFAEEKERYKKVMKHRNVIVRNALEIIRRLLGRIGP